MSVKRLMQVGVKQGIVSRFAGSAKAGDLSMQVPE